MVRVRTNQKRFIAPVRETRTGAIGININHLKMASGNIHKNKFWKVLNYLQQERKVKSLNGIIHVV